MSRRVYLLGLGLALVALALSATDWALSLRPGITEANAKRIRPGMTLQEAEVLLGGPGKVVHGGGYRSAPYRWDRGQGYALVWLTLDGRVRAVRWCPPEAPTPGPLARLRTWLGW